MKNEEEKKRKKIATARNDQIRISYNLARELAGAYLTEGAVVVEYI